MRLLIRNILTLLSSDSGFEVKEASIVIENDKIVQVGDIDLSTENEPFDEVIDGKNKLALPGLVNAHTHSYMTLFRNHADDLPFHEWLFGKILPLEDKLVAEDAYWGSMLGIMEMIGTGTTCFADMYMFPDVTSRAVDESGIRACLSRGLVGSGTDAGGKRRLAEAIKEMEGWRGASSGRLTYMLAPHAPYTCEPDYLHQIVEAARNLSATLNIHLSESLSEVHEIKEKYHKTPTQYMRDAGVFSLNTVAAHCVHLTEEDMDIIAEYGVHVASNPVSNLKLASGIAPIKRLMDRHVNICLGTDSAASNNSLNLFKELQMMALIHKGILLDAEAVIAQDVLKFATINGAKAFGLQHQIGKIEVGMKADICLLNIDQPQFYPHANWVSALAYSTLGSEVQTVIVDGKILMKDKIFLTIDSERVTREVQLIYKRLCL